MDRYRFHSYAPPMTGSKRIMEIVMNILRVLLIMAVTLWILLLPIGDPKEACKKEMCKKDTVASSVPDYSVCHLFKTIFSSVRYTADTVKEAIRGTKMSVYKILSEVDKEDLCSVVNSLYENELYPEEEPKFSFFRMFTRKSRKCNSRCGRKKSQAVQSN